MQAVQTPKLMTRARQKLLMLTRERDNAVIDGEDLRHELQLYKSSAAQSTYGTSSTSGTSSAGGPAKSTSVRQDTLETLPESEFGPDEMTLDEIM